MTSLPAGQFGLNGRGVVGPGAVVDLVLFGPVTVIDVATFERPIRLATGIDRVYVAGGRSGATTRRPGRGPGAYRSRRPGRHNLRAA